jgi:hypothetical protein
MGTGLSFTVLDANASDTLLALLDLQGTKADYQESFDKMSFLTSNNIRKYSK